MAQEITDVPEIIPDEGGVWILVEEDAAVCKINVLSILGTVALLAGVVMATRVMADGGDGDGDESGEMGAT